MPLRRPRDWHRRFCHARNIDRRRNHRPAIGVRDGHVEKRERSADEPKIGLGHRTIAPDDES